MIFAIMMCCKEKTGGATLTRIHFVYILSESKTAL